MGDEQAQAVPNTTTVAPEKSANDTVSQVDLTDASVEQLDQLFNTGKLELKPKPTSSGGEGQEQTTGKAAEEPAKPAAEKTETEVEATTTTTDEPGDKPAVTAEGEVQTEETVIPDKPAKPETTEEPEAEVSERFRHKDPTDRAINAVYKAAKERGQPITWAEAERRVIGEPAAQEDVKPPVTSEALKGTVVTLTTEVTDIEGQLDAVTARIEELGKDEQLFGPEHSKALKEQSELTKKLNAKNRELIDAKMDAREVESAEKQELAREQKEHLTGRQKAKLRAIELYPEVGDEKSPLGKAVAERIAEMRDPKHPDHSLLYADSAPFTVTATVAAEKGIAPKAKTATPTTAKPATTTQTRTTASPPSAAKTAVKTVQPAEAAKKTFEYLRDEASLEELDAHFGGDKIALLVPS